MPPAPPGRFRSTIRHPRGRRAHSRVAQRTAFSFLRVVLPVAVAGVLASAGSGGAQERLEPADVFGLEFATDPEIAPSGERIAYVRNFFDVMTDRLWSNLWMVSAEGGHRALTTGDERDGSPRWSPDGGRLLYASDRGEDGAQLWLRWMDGSGQEAKLTNLTESPSDLVWSPDGEWIAFTMFVPDPDSTFTSMPTPPEGAEWAEPAIVIDDVEYRADGSGYLRDGADHLFVLPATGGTPRRLTAGPYDHTAPAWTPDGRHLIVTANRREDRVDHPNDTELWEVSMADGSIRALTDRYGPDGGAVISPDGRWIAYTGFDDELQGYQVTELTLLGRDDPSERRVLAGELDRDLTGLRWSADGSAIYAQYDDRGTTRIARVGLDGSVEEVGTDVGGTSYGRPYAGGSFSIASDGTIAYTWTSPHHPAEVARIGPDGRVERLTALNDDLLGHKALASVEELWWESSFDGRRVQGWIMKPPGFDPSRRYPLVLEIHGGPFANYGPRFTAEAQLYAAAGYVVLYANPRGSTSYGEEFGNLIHHAYPGRDYDDLMSGVDAAITEGYVDPDRLFVTGGSGGGVLTAWIVGKTERFRAAVVQKPVIHWTSFVLTADASPFFHRYWFPAPPWEEPEHYWARSPLSLVGNVTTPTMLLTGEEDYRTPISETEQYYTALKLRGVPSVMVRIPGASHSIAARPSNLIRKVVHVLEWFARHGGEEPPVS